MSRTALTTIKTTYPGALCHEGGGGSPRLGQRSQLTCQLTLGLSAMHYVIATSWTALTTNMQTYPGTLFYAWRDSHV
jgi:hypothetical protein